MKIYLLRHAETDSNVHKIIQGTINTPLNPNGHAQAECLGRRMSSTAPAHVFCSDLQRCKETLQHVMDAQPNRETLPQVQYTAKLQERYMAELQGVSKEVVEKLCQEQNKTKFDFGESTAALTARVETFWKENILPLYTDKVPSSPGSDVVYICSHGGTLLHLTHALLSTFHFKLGAGIQISRASPNTGVTVLDIDTMTLELYADISHLQSLGTSEMKKDERMEVVDA